MACYTCRYLHYLHHKSRATYWAHAPITPQLKHVLSKPSYIKLYYAFHWIHLHPHKHKCHRLPWWYLFRRSSHSLLCGSSCYHRSSAAKIESSLAPTLLFTRSKLNTFLRGALLSSPCVQGVKIRSYSLSREPGLVLWERWSPEMGGQGTVEGKSRFLGLLLLGSVAH